MPIDPESVGTETATVARAWGPSDAMLYALAVGAGTGELEFTTEGFEGREQRVLPTYGVVLGAVGDALDQVGSFDPAMLVHGAQRLEVHAPIPAEGQAEVTGRIEAVFDKGSAAVVVVATRAFDRETGVPLFTNRSTAFIRGEGGFGGARGSSERVDLPERAPDATIEYETRPEQALLYRLTGDRNPLHSEPVFASRSGFDHPILHGLCTYGFTGRALLHALAGGDPDRFGTMDARFSAPVVPGACLTIEMWSTSDETLFRTRTDDGTVVIDGGRFWERR